MLRTGKKPCVAPRAIWSGSISFGLVNLPVRLYAAIAEHRLHFRLVHAPDEGAIGYEKVCRLEGKPVPDAEIVKAFEVRKGEFVHLSDDDFEHALVEGYRTIDITDFVPHEDIDPVLFAHAYYVGPAEGGEHVYALLARAMEDSGLTAVVSFVMRDRRHLGALRVSKGALVLEQLYYADEQRPIDAIKPSGQRVSKKELEMAGRLIESYAGPWKPEKYEDTYRDELLAAIESKGAGEPARAPSPEAEEQLDLMEALRSSLNAGRRAAHRPPKRKAAGRKRERAAARKKP